MNTFPHHWDMLMALTQEKLLYFIQPHFSSQVWQKMSKHVVDTL